VLYRPVFRELAKDTAYNGDPRIIFQFETFSPFCGRGRRRLQVSIQYRVSVGNQHPKLQGLRALMDDNPRRHIRTSVSELFLARTAIFFVFSVGSGDDSDPSVWPRSNYPRC
jgi:hypothetical protein